MRTTTSWVIAGCLAVGVGLGACASSTSEGTDEAEAPGGVAGVLQSLKKDIQQLEASIRDPKSAEDPETFRGQMRRDEKVLSDRLEKIRAQLLTAVGAEGDPNAPPAEASASDPKRAELMKELEETEASLERLRKKIKEQDSAASQPADD